MVAENPEIPLNDFVTLLIEGGENDDISTFGGTVTALLARVHAGDREAEDSLYRAVIDQLVGKAQKLLCGYRGGCNIVDPEELVAEVFPRLRRVLAGHDVANRQHFFRIACQNFRWKIAEILKARRRELAIEDVPEPIAGGTTVPSLAARRELIGALLREMDELDETQRQVVEYRVLLDMSFREIGELLGQPHTTVKYRFDQIIQRLRDRLPGQG